MKAFFSAEFVKFLLTGGFAAVVNFTSRIVYDLALSFSTAIVLAYLTGMVTAYVLARALVFERSGRPVGSELAWFSFINVLAIAQTWVVSMLLYHYVLPGFMDSYQKEVAHFIGIAVPVFTSFLGHKYLTFRKARTDDGVA